MKSRMIKLAACTLAGLFAVSAYCVPAIADNANPEINSQAIGVSLVLADVDTENGSEFAAAMKQDEIEMEEAQQEMLATTGVCQVGDYANVRSEASENGDIVGKMANNAVATIEGEEDGWYRITSGEISGYISADYLVVGDEELIAAAKTRIATVHADSLNVREDADEAGSVIGRMSDETKLVVTDESEEGWVEVATATGDTGYVSEDYVTVEDGYIYAQKPEEVGGGNAVAAYALQFVGNPYVYGGSSLTNGTDCSGFTMSVYARFGISLPHSSSAQRSCGRAVSYAEAQPGDIICYSGHVALYIGNGQIVHAANARKGIIVSDANYNKIICVRRMIG